MPFHAKKKKFKKGQSTEIGYESQIVYPSDSTQSMSNATFAMEVQWRCSISWRVGSFTTTVGTGVPNCADSPTHAHRALENAASPCGFHHTMSVDIEHEIAHADP